MINTSHYNYYHHCRALLFFLFLLNIANIHCYLYHHQHYHLHQSYHHHKYYYTTNNRRSNVIIPTVIPSPPSLHYHTHRQVSTRLRLKTECVIDPSQIFGFNDEDLVWEALRRDAVEGKQPSIHPSIHPFILNINSCFYLSIYSSIYLSLCTLSIH